MSDHTEAKSIYQAYLAKTEELAQHRAYAHKIVDGTSGSGRTPVEPLATWGNNGGPLLCDFCSKPIILEGGSYHNMQADDAWRLNPQDGWLSYILGGMTIDVLTNGTLRIYHGYKHSRSCCSQAGNAETEAKAEFRSRDNTLEVSRNLGLLTAYFEQELFPDKSQNEHEEILNKIFRTLWAFDPGIGINRP